MHKNNRKREEKVPFILKITIKMLIRQDNAAKRRITDKNIAFGEQEPKAFIEIKQVTIRPKAVINPTILDQPFKDLKLQAKLQTLHIHDNQLLLIPQPSLIKRHILD